MPLPCICPVLHQVLHTVHTVHTVVTVHTVHIHCPQAGYCLLHCSLHALLKLCAVYVAGVEVGRSLHWRVNVDGVADQWKLPFFASAPRCAVNKALPARACAEDGSPCECNGTVVFTQARGGRPPGRGAKRSPHEAAGFCWESQGSTKCDGRYGDSAVMYHKQCVCRPRQVR